MISVLSLAVAILAVFFGPLVARSSVQRQIRATAREAWMRDFRQHAAELLKNHGLRPGDGTREFELRVAMRFSYSALRLLIAEKTPQYDEYISHLNDIMKYQSGDSEKETFAEASAEVLRRERAVVMGDHGVWRKLVRQARRAPEQPSVLT